MIEQLTAVRDALAAALVDKIDPGSTITIEHPGYVCLTLIDGTSWNIGTAAGVWGGDRTDHAGRNVPGVFVTRLAEDAPAPVVVAAVVAAIEEWAGTLLPLTATIAQMKREILADMRAGVVPVTVRSFAELHDHVDANEYGGFCNPKHPNHEIDPGDEAGAEYVNAAQDSVHGWLARNGHGFDLKGGR